MSRLVTVRASVVLGLLLALGLPGAADDKKDKPKSDGFDAAAIEAMMKAGTPGPEHKRLEPLVGSWNCVVRMWMAPDAPPSESKGKTTRKWILDGRFVQDDTEGEFGGMSFRGFGLTGYDNLQKKYTSMWADNMSTAIVTSLGTYDASTKTFTYVGEMTDPVTTQKGKMKDVLRVEGADRHRLESYRLAPDGKETKMMEVIYTRAK